MAMTATCMTINTVQMPPKRRPPPPGPDCLRRVPMPRVTLSPGRSPAMAAAISVSSAAYSSVLGEMLECIQNGTRLSNMFSVTMVKSDCQATCADVTATRAATVASTNASTNNCPMIRPRPAPSAVRTRISFSRVAARANINSATLPQTRNTSRTLSRLPMNTSEVLSAENPPKIESM